jgi:excinuclease ABC subunit C
MEAAAAALEYETAARLRDQIATLKRIDEQQLTRRNDADADVIALAGDGSLCCVAVLFIRAGRNLGARAYFPQTATGVEAGEVLGAFISQFYMLRELPGEIITGAAVEDADLLERLLSQKAGRKVAIRHRVRGERARWVRLADTNASHSLQHRLSARSSIREQLEELRDALGLPEVPTRIECFDVSHSHGEATVASCVVFGTEGPLKSEYRRFNIKGRTPGDDYGAMREALSRRYTRLKRGEAALPDLLVLDGGKGQLGEALKVLEELQVNAVETVAIAKGPARRPGSEQLFVRDRGRPIVLAQDSRALHLLQRIRDEAHRFAIGGHRLQRARRRGSSVLEAVPGLGPKRRRELLRQFGGLQGVMRAGVDDLSRVHGISEALARRIYETLHPVS